MLTDKIAIVTGSTSGIGLGIAERLAQKGCHILLNGFGDAESIQKLIARLSYTYGVQVDFCEADLMQPTECEKLISVCIEKFKRVDILVNNAGIQFVAPVEEFPLDQWQRVLNLNLTAPFSLIQAALPHMRQNQWGRIVNIASVHGMVASQGKAAYVAAKHGLLGLTKVVALETATAPITCNAICPGWVYTPLVAQQIQQRAEVSGKTFEEEKKSLLMEKQPSGEFSQPEQVGGLVAFLCSEDASQVRGAAFTMDGGWTIQ